MRYRLAKKIFTAGVAADYCDARRVRRHARKDIAPRHFARYLDSLRGLRGKGREAEDCPKCWARDPAVRHVAGDGAGGLAVTGCSQCPRVAS